MVRVLGGRIPYPQGDGSPSAPKLFIPAISIINTPAVVARATKFGVVMYHDQTKTVSGQLRPLPTQEPKLFAANLQDFSTGLILQQVFFSYVITRLQP